VPVFVDTNVLVYARDSSEATKQPRASEWMGVLWRSHQGRLSFQVLAEFYTTVTRKLSPGLSPAEARDEVRDLLAWAPVSIDAAIFEDALDLASRFGLSLWDAQIVAAARAAGCEHLLTEDLQPDQLFGSVRVVDPFSASPGALGLEAASS
jgi:predicted nucleic acid-binding protein